MLEILLLIVLWSAKFRQQQQYSTVRTNSSGKGSHLTKTICECVYLLELAHLLTKHFLVLGY
jgi:hypothetical protein